MDFQPYMSASPSSEVRPPHLCSRRVGALKLAAVTTSGRPRQGRRTGQEPGEARAAEPNRLRPRRPGHAEVPGLEALGQSGQADPSLAVQLLRRHVAVCEIGEGPRRRAAARSSGGAQVLAVHKGKPPLTERMRLGRPETHDQVLPPACERFLEHHLGDWDGLQCRKAILGLLAHVPVRPFEGELRSTRRSPMEAFGADSVQSSDLGSWTPSRRLFSTTPPRLKLPFWTSTLPSCATGSCTSQQVT